MGELLVEPLDAPLGAAVSGLAPGALAPAVVDELHTALGANGVLVFSGRTWSPAEFVALGRAFGELEILPEPDKRHPDHPEIFNLTNVRSDGTLVYADEPQAVFLRGTERWHTDSSFRAVPCLCTMLYAIEVPPTGGETQFADMVAGLDELTRIAPELSAEVAGAGVVHSYEYSRANNPGRLEPMTDAERRKYPPVVHPLIRSHAQGRRSLYLGGHASHLEGRDEDVGRALLAEIEGIATAPDVIYTHRWQPSDLVIWDNRTVLHRLRPYDIANHRRSMLRITVAGTEAPRSG
ncbi:MAG: TauD/TfdA family dioxygenase [Actinomycetota bacterium]